MKIYTGYYKKCNDYKKAGLVLCSISVGKYKYFKIDIECNQLKPTWEMVKTGYLEKEYEAKILNKINIKEFIKNLEAKTNGKDVIFLCYEKNDNDCHRSFVKRWLNKNGIECEEKQTEILQLQLI
jgi:uncharacterized protein YeaO (DUF488 family)